MTKAFKALVLSVAMFGQVVQPFAAIAQSVDDTSMAGEGDVQAAAEDANPSSQDAFYCGERKLGTWFYCDKPKERSRTAKSSDPQASATERLAMITKELDELRAKAILEPTTSNVSDYIRYQRTQLDRASTFADVWQRALWQNPSLDYTLQRPVNTLGKTAWTDQRKYDQQKTMSGLSQRYGVFFFYSTSCGACDAFSPVLKGISERYNLSILPVSMDGGANPYFPKYVVNQGQYEKMGLSGGMVPALVLYDTVTKRPMPVGYGVMAEDEVMDRIFRLTAVKVGSDF